MTTPAQTPLAEIRLPEGVSLRSWNGEQGLFGWDGTTIFFNNEAELRSGGYLNPEGTATAAGTEAYFIRNDKMPPNMSLYHTYDASDGTFYIPNSKDSLKLLHEAEIDADTKSIRANYIALHQSAEGFRELKDKWTDEIKALPTGTAKTTLQGRKDKLQKVINRLIVGRDDIAELHWKNEFHKAFLDSRGRVIHILTPDIPASEREILKWILTNTDAVWDFLNEGTLVYRTSKSKVLSRWVDNLKADETAADSARFYPLGVKFVKALSTNPANPLERTLASAFAAIENQIDPPE